jgi:diacylglycerol kinase family enzyme
MTMDLPMPPGPVVLVTSPNSRRAAGTVGAVAHHLADTRVVLGVLPLGTSNDFARSLGISMRIDRAVGLLRGGKVSTIDLGRLVVPGRDPLHFVHAATVGLNVSFARLATRASLRRRLGRLTYAFAAAVALRELPMRRVLLAAIYQLFHVARPLEGVHAMHVREMRVHTEVSREVALDGEVLGTLPADFVVAGEALRVVTPLGFDDVEDDDRERSTPSSGAPDRTDAPRA